MRRRIAGCVDDVRALLVEGRGPWRPRSFAEEIAMVMDKLWVPHYPLPHCSEYLSIPAYIHRNDRLFCVLKLRWIT